MRRAAPRLLLASLLAAGSAVAQPTSPPSGPAGFAYARAVEVPAAGWVRVPLDAAALRHAAAAGSTLQVIGPEGEEVYRLIEAYQPPGERRPVRVLGVEESPSGEGWVLLLDLGPSPPAHERLLFDFDRRVAAPDVQLEGSADARAWEPLASGGLFRLGGSEDLRRTTLAYPRTDLRYLRLTWPREGGFPEVSRVEVEVPSGPVLALAVERPDCRPLGRSGTACLLPLPAAGLTVQRLVLEVAGSGSLGYRLDQARDGGWWREIEGVRLGSGTGARTLHLTLGPTGLFGDLVRLELFGDGARPVLAAARVEAAVPTVLFQAPAPGVYTLAYGGVPVPPGLANAPPKYGGKGGGSPEQAAWREAGPERQLPPPDLPGSGPGEPLPEVRFLSSWKVRAPAEPRVGAARSRVVRLELPPEVYARARPDLADLRLAVGIPGQEQGRERQIPFLRWTPPDPAAVPLPAAGAGGELAVARVDRREFPSYTSGFTVDLPGPPRTPLAQILVTLPPGPLGRPVGLEVRAGRAGAPELQATGYVNQPCASRPPLPCRAEFTLAGNARAAGDRWLAEPARMAVLFFDGDDPPLSGVAVEAFRRRDVLVFIWPEGAPAIRLLAGAPELEAPLYQLARLHDGLLAQPWRPAALEALSETPPDGERPGRWLLLGTLGLAAVALVVLLRRVLKEV